jgi:hypothetical protein
MLARYLLALPLAAVLEATREEMPLSPSDAAGGDGDGQDANVEVSGGGLTSVGRTVERILRWLEDVDNSDFENLHAEVVAEQGDDLPEAIGDEVLLG